MNIEALLKDGIAILTELELPREQINERTSYCLLAFFGLSNGKDWQQAQINRLTIRGILNFARNNGRDYAENTRESIRKYSVKQLVAAGLLLHNPDDPSRATNSSLNCYEPTPEALQLIKSFKTPAWQTSLKKFGTKQKSLSERYSRDRAMAMIPLCVNNNETVKLSPGPHSELIKAIIEEFAPRFLPGGTLVYVGDTGEKWGYCNEKLLKQFTVTYCNHGKMPDVVIYHEAKNWLVLAEAVTSCGPIDGMRYDELTTLFKNSNAGLIFVTAFADREMMRKYLSTLAWETEVWCKADPTHLIHFNGSKFLGPYRKS